MKKFLPCLLSVLSFSEVYAQTRASSISLMVERGDDEYKSREINGNIGTSKSFTIDFRYFSSEIEEQESSHGQLGFSVFLWPVLDLSLSVGRIEEPNEMEGLNNMLRLNYEISHLWNGFYRTYIFLGHSRTRYQQNDQVSGQLTTLQFSTDFLQSESSFGIEQELGFYFVFGAEYMDYDYSDASVVSGSSQFAQLNFTRDFNGASGFPDRSLGAYIIAYPWEFLQLEYRFNDTDSNLDELDTKTYSYIGVVSLSKHWSLQLSYSETKTENEQDFTIKEAGIIYLF